MDGHYGTLITDK